MATFCSQLPAVVYYRLGIGKLQLMGVQIHHWYCVVWRSRPLDQRAARSIPRVGYVAIGTVYYSLCVVFVVCRVVVVAVVNYCLGIGKQINHWYCVLFFV